MTPPALIGSRCTTCSTVYFPPASRLLPQPGLRRRGVRGCRAEPLRRHVVLHRCAVPAASRRTSQRRGVRPVRAGRRRAARRTRRARPGRRRLHRRRTSASGPRSSSSSSRADVPEPVADLALEADREPHERRRRRCRHAPVGQVGQELRRVRRRRRARRTRRTPASPGRTSTSIVGRRDGAQRLRRLCRGFDLRARPSGWNGARVATSYAACATGAQALDTARARILAGLSEVALVVGADTTPKGFLAPNAGERWDDPDWLRFRLLGMTNPAYFALYARRRMDLFGATSEDFAAVKVKNSKHGLANPHARYRKAVSVADVALQRGRVRPASPPRHLRHERRRRRGHPVQ